MTSPTPYLQFAGDAREALEFYRSVFGGELELATHEAFGRDDGHPAWIAHGRLAGPVDVFAADETTATTGPRLDGVLLSLLGHADPDTLRRWFDGLAEGGVVIDALAERPWGASDGLVRDRFGLTWLIGWEPPA